METVVNILPISHQFDLSQMRSRVLAGIEALCATRVWHGRRVLPQLDLVGEVLTIRGGRRRLCPKTIRFVTVDFDLKRRNEAVFLEQWASQFDKLILIVDALELMGSHRFRHEVAIRRLALQAVNRRCDVSLMVMDADRIMDIADTGDYATTYLGACSAFSSTCYNASRLHDQYQRVWDEVSSLFLAQEQSTFRRRCSGRKVTMPQLLICHCDSYAHMGFQEMLTLCIDAAVKAHGLHLSNLSTLQTYNNMSIIQNIQDLPFLRDLIKKKQASKNYIRVAVIGYTSSGKSYFLTDAVISLKKMGFISQSVAGHPSASDFLNFVNDYDSGVEKTSIYACRPINQFVSRFSMQSDNFILDFVDVPGEVVTKDSISEFCAILKALSEHTSPVFQEKTWSCGNRKWKTIEYGSGTSNQSVAGEQLSENGEGIVLSGASRENVGIISKTSENEQPGITGGRTRDYQSNEVVATTLEKQRFVVESSVRMVSGQYVLEHLEDYVTDTVVNAIIDAWDILGIDDNLSNVQLREEYAGIKPNDSNKTRFSNMYKNHFYFHYYTFFATDIVICDKCTLPSSIANVPEKEKNDSTKVFWGITNALSVMLEQSGVIKKNLFLAFKGIDSVMKQEKLQKIWKAAGKDANLAYSQFVAIFLANKIAKERQENEFLDDDETLALADNASDYWQKISGREGKSGSRVMKACFEHYQNPEDHGCYIKGNESYQVISDKGLYEHIFNRIKGFLGIPMTVKVPNGEKACVGKILGDVPPHVYFTASAVDDDFNICGLDPKTTYKSFLGEAAYPSNRICFGTYQLMSDMLLQHGIRIPENAKCIGTLLSYFYGNPQI